MSKTILIVDDSATMLEIASLAIEQAGYKLIQASNAKQALSKLDGQKIHLFLSDINMPGMGGIDFVKYVKAIDCYKFTPILMLTTEVSPAKKQAAREAGASGWVQKPFQVSILLSAIDKFVGH
jgi:two-component system chemotaxis response regulator CheY